MGLEQKIAVLKNFEQTALTAIRSEVVLRSAEIIADNREQIFTKSITHKGTPIINKRFNAPVYSKKYEAYKRRKGLFQGHIDLSLSGKWLDSLQVILTFDGFLISANGDRQTFDLTGVLRRWFPNAEGLTSQNIDNFKENFIRPRLEQELRKAL